MLFNFYPVKRVFWITPKTFIRNIWKYRKFLGRSYGVDHTELALVMKTWLTSVVEGKTSKAVTTLKESRRRKEVVEILRRLEEDFDPDIEAFSLQEGVIGEGTFLVQPKFVPKHDLPVVMSYRRGDRLYDHNKYLTERLGEIIKKDFLTWWI